MGTASEDNETDSQLVSPGCPERRAGEARVPADSSDRFQESGEVPEKANRKRTSPHWTEGQVGGQTEEGLWGVTSTPWGARPQTWPRRLQVSAAGCTCPAAAGTGCKVPAGSGSCGWWRSRCSADRPRPWCRCQGPAVRTPRTGHPRASTRPGAAPVSPGTPAACASGRFSRAAARAVSAGCSCPPPGRCVSAGAAAAALSSARFGPAGEIESRALSQAQHCSVQRPPALAVLHGLAGAVSASRPAARALLEAGLGGKNSPGGSQHPVAGGGLPGLSTPPSTDGPIGSEMPAGVTWPGRGSGTPRPTRKEAPGPQQSPGRLQGQEGKWTKV